MGIRESIDWCNDRASNARDTLSDINHGARYHHNDEDITDKVSSKAVVTIASMAAMIAAYLLAVTN